MALLLLGVGQLFGYEDAFNAEDEKRSYSYSIRCESTTGYVLVFTWQDTFGKLS